MIIVLGKGHAGTSLVAGILKHNGVFMGEPLNKTLDYLAAGGRWGQPLQGYFDAVRAYAQSVIWDGKRWLFIASEPPPKHRKAIDSYTRGIREHRGLVGYKMPSSILMLPWLAQMYPHAHFILIRRNYQDNTRRSHDSDDLGRWGVPGPANLPRMWSWVYHDAIVAATPKPSNWLELDYDATIRDPDATIRELGFFLGINMTLDGFIIKQKESHHARIIPRSDVEIH